MPFLKNPLIEEDFNLRFFTPSAVVLTAVHLGLQFMMLLFVWPRTSLSDAILFGDTPVSFRVIAVLSFFSLSVINGILGAEPFGEKRGYQCSEWLRLSPVSLRTFLLGKMAASFLHAILLTFITLPFLLLAGAVSGIDAATVLTAAAAIFVFTFTYRVMAFSLRLFLEKRFFSLYLLLTILLVVMIFGTAAIHPLFNPIFALSRLDSGETLLVMNMVAADASAMSSGIADPDAGLAQVLSMHTAVLVSFLSISLIKSWKIRRVSVHSGRKP